MKKSTIAFIAIIALIFIGILIACVQLNALESNPKFVDEHFCPRSLNMRHVITLSEHNLNHTMPLAERFPYVAAVTRNATNLWTFACFASVILVKWIVTSAHCRVPGHTHRVVLFHDFARNHTHSFPIQYWRVHERYNSSIPNPKYDIAVAKLNLEHYHSPIRSAVFDESKAVEWIEASVWKTVSTMDKKLYLTNHFEKYELRVGPPGKCFESYGVEIDDSLICIDSSRYDDCFIHEFGPIYSGDKLVGLVTVNPVDCDVKLSIFTNISYYTNWLLRATHGG